MIWLLTASADHNLW